MNQASTWRPSLTMMDKTKIEQLHDAAIDIQIGRTHV